MGTGIMSIGLSLDGLPVLSSVLLVMTALAWCALVVAVARLAVGLRGDHLSTPAALTWVAGTVVLGTRVSRLGWNNEAALLLGIAFGLWLLLVPFVVGRWRTPTVGVSFLLAVATEAIAVLAARLAIVDDLHALTYAALAFCALGLALYVVVLARFERRQLLHGGGDHWIAGGALAIATLACALCAQAATPLHNALDTAALVLWAASAAWLPVLIGGELTRRRAAADVRRWSTVFPLGMYAVCSFAAGRAAGVGGLVDFARVWIWVAFAAWLAAAAVTLARLTGP
jgi:hypothetical protein